MVSAQKRVDFPSVLEATETFQPQVVLLDIGLPEMDGYQVAERRRSQPETSPRQLTSALRGIGCQREYHLQAGVPISTLPLPLRLDVQSQPAEFLVVARQHLGRDCRCLLPPLRSRRPLAHAP